jgi:uncharacterized protein (TIGR00303 family)
MRLIVVAGSTETADIGGITAAGATPSLIAHTPAADAEVLVHGQLTRAPVLPVSPSGCPTPAVVTRAAVTLTSTPVTVVDAGMATPPGAPTVRLGDTPGADIRTGLAVPTGHALFAAGQRYGRGLSEQTVILGETIPGGTTTALAVRMALGVSAPTSSSLPENPLEQKHRICASALTAAGLPDPAISPDPVEVLSRVGDPVLIALTGIAHGAIESGTRVILGGGTQLVSVIAVLRAMGVQAPLVLATTPYLLADVPGLPQALDPLGTEVRTADPRFDGPDAGPLSAYTTGVAKEGAGMGGALWLAAKGGVLSAVAQTAGRTLTRMVAAHPTPPSGDPR